MLHKVQVVKQLLLCVPISWCELLLQSNLQQLRS